MRHSLFLTLGLTTLAACAAPSTDDSGATDTDTDINPAEASVRVMHLSPDAPAVDVFVDGMPDAVLTDLGFTESSTYLTVPAGTYTFRVAPAGAGVDAAVLTIPDLALAAGGEYTAVAYDYLADITPKALGDDVSDLAAGSFRVNVMHGAPGVGEVDIWALTDSGASPLLEDVPFGANAPLDLPAGRYRVGFDVDNDATPDVSFQLPELPAGLYVNLYATNDTDGNVFLLAQLPDGTVARVDAEPPPAPTTFVRVLHLSPDAPAVDVWVDGLPDPVVTSLAFGEGTDYLEIPEGTYTFRVSPAGTDPASAVLVVEDLALAGGDRYTAAAIGELADISALALNDDLTGIPAGSYRAQVVHAAAAVGQVDIWEVSGEPIPLFVDVDFGAVASADLPSAAYTLGLDVNDDGSPDVVFAVPELPAGIFVNVFAVNNSDGDVYLLAEFQDGSLVQIDPV